MAFKKTLRSQEAYFRSLIENTADIITVLDSKQAILFESPSLERVLGFKPAELIGRNGLDYVHPEDRPTILEHLKQGMLVPGSIHGSIYRCRHKDGSWRYLESKAKYLAKEAGIQGIVITSRDVTDQKRIEQMKDEFIEVASHELRTPLSVLRLAVGQVHGGYCGEISERQKKILAMALGGVDRLSRLVDDLLDLRKMEAGEMPLHRERLSLGELMGEIRTMFEPRLRERNLIIRIPQETTNILVWADRDRLIQVFYNLIGNALKFTEAGWIEIGCRQVGRMAECWVADSGKGIALQDLDRLFGKFEQLRTTAVTDEKGTGLGLCITKGIIEMHGGEIRVESTPGQGTRFLFTIPLAQADAGKQAA